ncbi:MAG: amidohydrolase family protein [Planctomycetes bacterium]|nr:amidohydrolase family protein [Planctomycetota bacterium]
MTAARIDSHQHFWRYSAAEYGWIDDSMAMLRRDFLPADLQPILAAQGIDGCIAVQARQTLEETRFLLDLAQAHEFVRGVVGWVDLRSPEVHDQLREFGRNPKFVGVRHIVQAETDDRWLLRDDVQAGIAALAPRDLVYDLLVFPHQLPAAIELCARFPGQTFVLDHLAKPYARTGERQPWQDRIGELAKLPNVHCKISGLCTEADWQTWTADSLRPWFDVVLAAFGPRRLLFGSDWPVCLVASTYDRWVTTVDGWLGELSDRERTAIRGGNALATYRLPKRRPAR